MRLDGSFISRIIPAVEILGKQEFFISRATHDSRNVVDDMAFFALRGAHQDGHSFSHIAYQKGASIFVFDASMQNNLSDLIQEICKSGKTVLLVPSVVEALYKIAAAWRQQFKIPVIGITGTVGKTTTKELLAQVLYAAGHVCLASSGNLNTKIGLALTLLQLSKTHTIAVMEMGISQPGEMTELANLVRPTMGVITTLGHQHMDGLPRMSDIAREKRQIFSFFQADNIGFIHGDIPHLDSTVYNHPIVRFGCKRRNQVHARRISYVDGTLRAFLHVFDEVVPITFPVPHKGYLSATLVVAAVAYMLEIPLALVCQIAKEFSSIDGRFFCTASTSDGPLVINDAYNANPESVREALHALDKLSGYPYKIAILGDMLGLGEQSVFWHRQVGRMFRNVSSISHVVFVGAQSAQAVKTIPHVIPMSHVASWEDVVDVLPSYADRAAILLKASNGVGLSKLVSQLAR